MSDVDIAGGARWTSELRDSLKQSELCIPLITPENAENAWVTFEAGAVAHNLGREQVCPLLIGMTPTELQGPLSQFQARVLDEDGVRRLLADLNGALPNSRLSSSDLDEIHDAWGARLLNAISKALGGLPPSAPVERSDGEMLAEVVTLCRSLKRVQDDGRSLVSNFAPTEAAGRSDDPEWLAAYARLHSWALALVNAVRISYDEMEAVATGITPMPNGCLSRESMALMVARQIEKKLVEVNGAFEDLSTAIGGTDNKPMQSDGPAGRR